MAERKSVETRPRSACAPLGRRQEEKTSDQRPKTEGEPGTDRLRTGQLGVRAGRNVLRRQVLPGSSRFSRSSWPDLSRESSHLSLACRQLACLPALSEQLPPEAWNPKPACTAEAASARRRPEISRTRTGSTTKEEKTRPRRVRTTEGKRDDNRDEL